MEVVQKWQVRFAKTLTDIWPGMLVLFFDQGCEFHATMLIAKRLVDLDCKQVYSCVALQRLAVVDDVSLCHPNNMTPYDLKSQ